ncbi:hypothetical protein GCM10011519_14320 [Marmoricola endophyticus]|uniref:Uncharacterized protein n=1 Tax=Marmoricola endophyticus TaxID=2040280 RepID=A0A917BIK1_9ACTN|nr:hypothetical protein [Marmoricola endophyticus]GGF41657.1 hypothetical protein GCM10011519_14320 [Marmoricola endophyticus]
MNLSKNVLARTAAGTLAGAGLVTASVIGAQQATAGPSGSTTSLAAHSPGQASACRSTSHHHSPLGVRIGKAPQSLTKDLQALRAKQREGLAAIRKDAADGKYGKEVQERVEKREQRIEKHRASLPEKLRSDLDALQKMQPGADRRAAAQKIREGRLSGAYGAEVQEHAQTAKKKQDERKQTCQDQRQQRKEDKESGSSSTEG